MTREIKKLPPGLYYHQLTNRYCSVSPEGVPTDAATGKYWNVYEPANYERVAVPSPQRAAARALTAKILTEFHGKLQKESKRMTEAEFLNLKAGDVVIHHGVYGRGDVPKTVAEAGPGVNRYYPFAVRFTDGGWQDPSGARAFSLKSRAPGMSAAEFDKLQPGDRVEVTGGVTRTLQRKSSPTAWVTTTGEYLYRSLCSQYRLVGSAAKSIDTREIVVVDGQNTEVGNLRAGRWRLTYIPEPKAPIEDKTLTTLIQAAKGGPSKSLVGRDFWERDSATGQFTLGIARAVDAFELTPSQRVLCTTVWNRGRQ